MSLPCLSRVSLMSLSCLTYSVNRVIIRSLAAGSASLRVIASFIIPSNASPFAKTNRASLHGRISPVKRSVRAPDIISTAMGGFANDRNSATSDDVCEGGGSGRGPGGGHGNVARVCVQYVVS